MPVESLIAAIISIALGVFVYIKVFPIFCVVERFCDKLLSPVDHLCALFSSRRSFLSHNKLLRLIVVFGVFIASVCYITISFSSSVDYVALIKSLLSANALLGLGDLVTTVVESQDSNIYAAFISIGISSFLSFLYMRCTVDTLDEMRIPKVLKFLFLVLFNALFSLISFLLSGYLVEWCNNAIVYITGIFHQLAGLFTAGSYTLWRLLKIIFLGLFFLLLLYAAFNAIVLTFREILATVMYALFAIGLLSVICILDVMIPDFPTWLTSFLCTLLLIIPDYIRANENAKDRFIQFIRR